MGPVFIRKKSILNVYIAKGHLPLVKESYIDSELNLI